MEELLGVAIRVLSVVLGELLSIAVRVVSVIVDFAHFFTPTGAITRDTDPTSTTSRSAAALQRIDDPAP